jgi:hypothetical protein
MDGSFHPDLALEFSPIKDQCRKRVLLELLRFPALVIGEKNEPIIAKFFKQDGAGRRLSGCRCRRQSHCIGFLESAAASFRKPSFELGDGIRRSERFDELGSPVFLAEIGERLMDPGLWVFAHRLVAHKNTSKFWQGSIQGFAGLLTVDEQRERPGDSESKQEKFYQSWDTLRLWTHEMRM